MSDNLIERLRRAKLRHESGFMKDVGFLLAEAADAIAARDAEIEALRKKLAEYQVAESVAFSRQRVAESKAEEFRMRWLRAEERLAACDSDLRTMQHRAERLAEALREIESVAQGYVKDVASDYLRDHDQEVGNG